MIAVGIIFFILAVFLIVVGTMASTKRLPGNSYIGLRLQEIRKSREAWDNAHRVAGPAWRLDPLLRSGLRHALGAVQDVVAVDDAAARAEAAVMAAAA